MRWLDDGLWSEQLISLRPADHSIEDLLHLYQNRNNDERRPDSSTIIIEHGTTHDIAERLDDLSNSNEIVEQFSIG